jgi:hypothetical protein
VTIWRNFAQKNLVANNANPHPQNLKKQRSYYVPRMYLIWQANCVNNLTNKK